MTRTAEPAPLASGFETPSYAAWKALVDKALKGADFEKRLVAKTADGIAVKPLYTRTEAPVGADAALPGSAPFTRGTAPVRDGLGWDITTIVVESDPRAANAVILEELDGGVTSIALQISPSGGRGLPPTKDALSTTLKDVLLDVCPVELVAFEAVTDAATALNRVWDERRIANDQRRGSYGADPLGTLALTGRLHAPINQALATAAALAKSALPMPHVKALIADGHPYQVAGATEAQELAAVLSTLVAYLRACETSGIAPADTLSKISIGLAADIDQFLTIAKMRAARRLVFEVAKACGAGAAAAHVKLASATSFRMMAKRDPWTNILRTTIACAGAAFGGADSICVLPFTFALGKPDAFARRVARNIQIVCQEESNLGRVIDPAGGSWYVENLTNDLAAKAWTLFQSIEAKGGMTAALTSGFIQDEIAKSADARAKAIVTGRINLTGVSAFPLLADDGVKVEPWLAPNANFAAPVPAAVTVTPLKISRLGEPFEVLRDAADAYKAKTGAYPKVFMASLGAIIDHNVRSTWIKNYLAAGGIDAIMSDGFTSADEATTAFKTSGASAACIASSDALYDEHAEATAKALKASGAKLVLMAGRPGEKEAALKAAGVDQFLFAGADAVATLTDLQSKLGATA